MAESTGNRQGLATNPIETDKRFLRLEEELTKKQDANAFASRTTANRTVEIPQVSGVSFDTNSVGALAIRWSPVATPNLKRYEVEISTTSAFVSGQTERFSVTGGTTYTYSGGDQDTTYFVRVRAVGAVGNREVLGFWSSSLNSETGVATPNHLSIGAATNLTSDLIISFSPAVISTNENWPTIGDVTTEATFGSALIETVGGVVLPFVVTDVSATSQLQSFSTGRVNRLTTSLFRDGEKIDEAINDFSSDLQSTTSRFTIAGFTTPDVPPPGVHIYSVRYVVSTEPAPTATDWLTLEFNRQNIEVLELRR